MTEPSTPPADDYDTPWKDAVTRYFPEFMAFYFAEAHEQIEWSRGYTFLDQELAQVVKDAELGKRLIDKLVQVATHDGGEQWVYIHIEVQGGHESNFAERLFTYNYRLYDKYRRPVATLAVLADDREHWKPHAFGYELFGCEVGIRFPTVKLLDYHPHTDALLQNPNPFALVTAAHLLTRQTKGDDRQRLAAKWRLAKLLYERDWDKQRIILDSSVGKSESDAKPVSMRFTLTPNPSPRGRGELLPSPSNSRAPSPLGRG